MKILKEHKKSVINQITAAGKFNKLIKGSEEALFSVIKVIPLNDAQFSYMIDLLNIINHLKGAIIDEQAPNFYN